MTSHALPFDLIAYDSVLIVTFEKLFRFLYSLSISQYAAARAWTKWEMETAHLLPNEENIKKGDDDVFSLVS